MQGKEKIDYLSDDLKEVLESTYGIIIYQEQIMQIATKNINKALEKPFSFISHTSLSYILSIT